MPPAPTPIPPGLLARCEQILADRNADGVPTGIMCDILTGMADAVARQRTWSCATYRKHGLHSGCPHHELAAAS